MTKQKIRHSSLMWFVVKIASLAALPYEDKLSTCSSHLPRGLSLELFSGVFEYVLVFWHTANDKTPDEVR